MSQLTGFTMTVYQACSLAVLLQLCVFCLAAPPIARNISTTAPLPVSNFADNPTLNLTLASPRNPLPPQPYIYTVPHSSLKIKFQEFGHRIPLSNVLLCLLKAANDVNLHSASPDTAVEPSRLRTSSATVRLDLYPNGRHGITWVKWGAAIRGITDFMTKYGYVDLDFYVLDDDFGGTLVAGGLVSNR